MSRLKLELPVIQNWSCHNCGGCCRQHLIEVTDAERQRILAQNWTSNDGIQLPVMKWHAGPPWKKRYRLAHQSDGGCVFLDEKGLCRIHAKFGEAAKPLACRIYPYAFHPSGKSYAVSLRYSCPSVVANLGTAVSEQTAELRRLAEGVIPERREHPAPRLTERSQVEWSDFLPFVEALDHTMIDPTAPLSLRLARAVTWTTLVGQSAFESLKGQRIREFIGLLMEAARSEWSTVPAEPGEPDRVTRIYFRTLVAQYARKDTAADLSSGIAGRWRLFRSILKFTRGQGDIPPLQDCFQSVPFATLEHSFGSIDPVADEILTRYFRVKIQGLHFCGPAYYGRPFAEGFHSLALMFPVILWLARWLAASQGRSQTSTTDISQAMTIADHHHGYSPALGQPAAQSRVRSIVENNGLNKLLFWYSR